MNQAEICVCGHAESTHLRIFEKCRAKKCSCKRFINEDRVRFLQQCAKDAATQALTAQIELRLRSDEKKRASAT